LKRRGYGYESEEQREDTYHIISSMRPRLVDVDAAKRGISDETPP